MNKRIGWTVTPGENGKFWVAALFDDGTVGGGSLQFGTEAEFQYAIDSGEADRIAGTISQLKLEGRR